MQEVIERAETLGIITSTDGLWLVMILYDALSRKGDQYCTVRTTAQGLAEAWAWLDRLEVQAA